ncbi:MAG: RDD family protein [Acidimicrobiales bacterium]
MAYPVPTDPTAVFSRRILAALIDAALILIPTFLLLTASFEYFSAEALDARGVSGEQFCDQVLDGDGFCADFTDIDGIDRVYFADRVAPGSTLLYWGGTLALLVVLQGLTGWTVGKLITGIRTVREDGRPPGLVKALVRWLLWIVDGFPYFLPLVGFIVGLTTVGHRRVGDMVAKTFVVRASAAGSPIVVPGLTAPPPVGGGWGAPPPGASGPTSGWGQAVDPSSAGWATPTVAAPAPPSDAPQWDEARGTYIQWDPAQRTWMQWDEGSKAWSSIPGQ